MSKLSSFLRALIFLSGQVASAVLICPLAVLCLVLPSLWRARIISSWARFNICSLVAPVAAPTNAPVKK